MNRIILDHVRRWWLLWLTIGIGNMLAACVTFGKDQIFSYALFPLMMWCGAFQLRYDLSRGLARALGSVPVTLKEIGRAWWLASVALPALLLAVTGALGLAGYVLLAGKTFSLAAYGVTCITDTAILGALFYLT
ncbi:MAG: hypothetical protein RLZZ350_1343, partial [Verrucomicrobiota bacterium]